MSIIDPFNDKSIGEFLGERRKFIAGLLAIAGVLLAGYETGNMLVQAIIGFLGVYGVHEVANDTAKAA